MFILRGLPGSGKSTIADALLRQYKGHAVVCSADYYRYNKDGEYVWHEHTLQETHSKCQQRAQKFAALKKPVLIIGKSNRVLLKGHLRLLFWNLSIENLLQPKTCVYLHLHAVV